MSEDQAVKEAPLSCAAKHANEIAALRQQLAEKALERQELTRTFTATIERLEREKVDLLTCVKHASDYAQRLERERDEARAFLIPIRDELRSQMLCPMCSKMQNPGSPRNHRDDCAYVKLDKWLAAQAEKTE